MDNITLLLSELSIDSANKDISSIPISASCIGTGSVVCLLIIIMRIFIIYKKRSHMNNNDNDNDNNSEVI